MAWVMQFYSEILCEWQKYENYMRNLPHADVVWRVTLIVFALSFVVKLSHVIYLCVAKNFEGIFAAVSALLSLLEWFFYAPLALVGFLMDCPKTAWFFLSMFFVQFLEYLLRQKERARIEQARMEAILRGVCEKARREFEEEDARRRNPPPEPEKSKEESNTRTVRQESEGQIDFFANCNSLESLKKRYRDLAKAYHPDTGNGDLAISQMINAQYEEKIKKYQ